MDAKHPKCKHNVVLLLLLNTVKEKQQQGGGRRGGKLFVFRGLPRRRAPRFPNHPAITAPHFPNVCPKVPPFPESRKPHFPNRSDGGFPCSCPESDAVSRIWGPISRIVQLIGFPVASGRGAAVSRIGATFGRKKENLVSRIGRARSIHGFRRRANQRKKRQRFQRLERRVSRFTNHPGDQSAGQRVLAWLPFHRRIPVFIHAGLRTAAWSHPLPSFISARSVVYLHSLAPKVTRNRRESSWRKNPPRVGRARDNPTCAETDAEEDHSCPQEDR